jgi:hypothetical protein
MTKINQSDRGGHMATELSKHSELLKYPITVFSILAALIIAKFTLGIDFRSVSEVTLGGVKFAQESSSKIADLEGRLGAFEAQLTALNKTEPDADAAEQTPLSAKILEATETVSDQTAQLASLSDVKKSSGVSQKGFIWVGNFKKKWDRIKLAMPDTGQAVALPPGQLLPGTEYKALDNIVVREGVPENNKNSTKGKKIVGTVTRGATIRVVDTPKPVHRGLATQYWAEVEVI